MRTLRTVTDRFSNVTLPELYMFGCAIWNMFVIAFVLVNYEPLRPFTIDITAVETRYAQTRDAVLNELSVATAKRDALDRLLKEFEVTNPQ